MWLFQTYALCEVIKLVYQKYSVTDLCENIVESRLSRGLYYMQYYGVV